MSLLMTSLQIHYTIMFWIDGSIDLKSVIMTQVKEEVEQLYGYRYKHLLQMLMDDNECIKLLWHSPWNRYGCYATRTLGLVLVWQRSLICSAQYKSMTRQHIPHAQTIYQAAMKNSQPRLIIWHFLLFITKLIRQKGCSGCQKKPQKAHNWTRLVFTSEETECIVTEWSFLLITVLCGIVGDSTSFAVQSMALLVVLLVDTHRNRKEGLWYRSWRVKSIWSVLELLGPMKHQIVKTIKLTYSCFHVCNVDTDSLIKHLLPHRFCFCFMP